MSKWTARSGGSNECMIRARCPHSRGNCRLLSYRAALSIITRTFVCSSKNCVHAQYGSTTVVATCGQTHTERLSFGSSCSQRTDVFRSRHSSPDPVPPPQALKTHAVVHDWLDDSSVETNERHENGCSTSDPAQQCRWSSMRKSDVDTFR